MASTQRYIFFLCSALVGTIALGVPATAQPITPAVDDTNTIVTPNGNRFDITGGQKSGDGSNLFHSFTEFGLDKGQTANFLSQPNILNILARINGGNVSYINGLIQVTGGNSNLFLLNPSGIIFGQNASLNVPAAFTATTANGIGFNNNWFSAIGSNNYAALVGKPNAFAFTMQQPGSIINAGNLGVGIGQDLTLIAGSVINTGELTAPQGQITIASVPGQSTVRLSQPGFILGLEIQPSGLNANQPNDWSLPIASLPQMLTGGSGGNATGVTINPDGTIKLTGSGISIPTNTDITIISGNINANSSDKGGTVQILGNKVGVLAANINANGDSGGGRILIGGDFQGKGTVPNASQTVISQDSIITANANNHGNGGKVIVWADQFTGFYGNIQARGGKEGGNGGFVEVSGKELLIFTGMVDAGATLGKAGTLLLDPKNITIDTPSILEALVNVVFGLIGGSFNFPLAFDNNPGTDSVIPASDITNITNTGTDVVLQANNDITVNQAITTNNLTGNGGSITFQAGRSIIINNNITTNNGNLTLIGNETAANGVVDLYRDSGIAEIIIAPSVILDSGIGDTTITLNTGAGLTNNTSGDITLGGNFNARNLIIENKGPNNGAVIIPTTANINLTGNFAQIGNSLVTLGSTITTTGGNITFNGALTLTGNSILDSSSASNGTISLNNTVDSTSGENLTLNAGNGDITFSNAVGNTTELGNIIANSNSITNFNSTVKAATITTDASGTTTINGDITTIGDQTYNDIVNLTNSVSLTTTNNGNIIFNNTIDGTVGTENLSITTASGDIAFKNVVGSNTKIGNLTINNGGTLNIDAAADINLDGAFNQIGIGAVNTAGDITTTNNNIIFTSPVTLTGNVNFAPGTATISFGSTLAAGNFPLTLMAGEIDFSDAVTGSNTLILEPAAPAQNIILGGSNNSDTNILELTATDVNALQPGFSSITIGRNDGNGAISIAGNITFNDPVILQSPAPGGSINTTGFTLYGANNATFNLLADQDIVTGDIINSGGLIFITSTSGNIDSSAGTLDTSASEYLGFIYLSAPTSITVASIDATATSGTGSIIITSNLINFIGASNSIKSQGLLLLQSFTESENLQLNISNLNAIADGLTYILIGRYDGSGTITLPNDITFNDPVAIQSPFGSIIVNGAITGNDNASINILANAIALNAGITTADQDITINGNTTIGNNITISTDVTSGGNISFTDAIDGNNNLSLETGTGDIAIAGTIGANSNLGNFTINHAHNVTIQSISANSITQQAGSGTTNFQGTINTNTDAGINLTGTNFTFDNPITTTNQGNLTINNSGILNITENADINLDSNFNQIGTGEVIAAANITTTNKDIIFSSPVTLKGDVNFNLGTATISFGSTLTADNYPLILTANEIDFNGTVTGTNSLTLQPANPQQNILIGATDNNSNALDLTLADINNIQGNFSSITIGRNDSSGVITIANNVNFNSPVTIQSPAGLGTIIAQGQIISNNPTLIELLAASNITTSSIITSGGNITLTSKAGDIDTSAGILNSSSASGAGGALALNANHNITTSNITTHSDNLAGGNISLNSQQGAINTGDLDSSGNSKGGEINVITPIQITTGKINSSATTGNAGNVTLDPQGDIQIDYINAQGGTQGTGGTIDITTAKYFRARSSFTDNNGVQASISTAGGNGGGLIVIRHGGGSTTAFNVAADATTNGTSGNITSGTGPEQTVKPGAYLGPFTQGQTQVITEGIPPMETSLPPVQTLPPVPTASPPVQTLAPVEQTVSPPVQTLAPVEQTPSPPVQTLAPVEEGSSPVQPSSPPVQTLSPVEQTPSPPVQTLLPVEEGSSPVQPSSPPVQTLSPVVQTPSPSVQTPSPSVQTPSPSVQTLSPVVQTPSSPVQTSSDESRISTDFQGINLSLPQVQYASEIGRSSLDTTSVVRENIADSLTRGDLNVVISQMEELRRQEYQNYFGETLQVNNKASLSLKQIQNVLQQIATQSTKKPAILYVFVEPKQLNLVLVTSTGKPIYRRIPEADRETLLKLAKKFLSEITQPSKRNTTSYLASAQKLYQWLIAPIEPELQSQGIDNLVFSLDAGLRSMPLAALHDGQKFLVEKYSIGLIPSVNLIDTRYENIRNSQVLAMGASEFGNTNLEPLPAVPVELSTISQHIWPGKSFLNQEFTLANLKSERFRSAFAIIHLATHANFEPGEASNSYIQLWNSQLRLDQLRELGWNNPPVELLVLSACRTALGDEKTELGFGGLAVAAGVKSALASLWYVSDQGTLALMTKFYEHLKTAPIKAEALRQAQIAMIRGEVWSKNGKLYGVPSRPEGVILPLSQSTLENGNLSHPYYWSGFTMIGSPW